ncbi:restriction endonuclease subunit S [Burkholderia thailandensis]|uniref:restriction endonuclease subunit S n=1 Tax=Burkholderia thailandensis TaxID=57975 RepID=UPI0022AC7295|nr:restriction endonuclease subunit S [Burkholderia thailandensis]MCZ2903247.1 restriction endonuclease subunit S [Burkholderia thailandensis]MDD1484077.1 restriction endonuclease subunit S [Burkholderia thailandensis]MDD1489942.1 restriction endonuclease subunit S [Burkholderia thailandensis]
MANEWQTLSLAEIYDFSSGLSKPRSEFGSGHPFLSFKDVFYNSAVPKQLTELVQSTEQERARYSVMRGDVFLTRTSETMDELGMSSVALADIPDATFNGFTKRLRPKRELIAPGFARYFFRSSEFRAAVNSMSTMSTRASLNNEMLGRLTITFPEYAEQEAVAHILGTLDDKIELNRRMNETLEAISRALFKAWFVDFEPVRAKMDGRWQRGQSLPGLPAHLYDLFPYCLVDSELGEVPEGWEVTSLSEFSSLNAESWTKRTRPGEIHYVDLSNTKWGRVESVTDYEADDAPSRAQRVLRPMDTIVGTVRPGNGSYALISDEGLTGSTGFAVLRPLRRECSEFVYLAATSRENIERLSNLADGGAYPAVRPEIVSATQVPRAGQELINEFSRQVSPMLAGIADNERTSRPLAQLRDTLLPKLISGELRVPAAERIVGAAV